MATAAAGPLSPRRWYCGAKARDLVDDPTFNFFAGAVNTLYGQNGTLFCKHSQVAELLRPCLETPSLKIVALAPGLINNDNDAVFFGIEKMEINMRNINRVRKKLRDLAANTYNNGNNNNNSEGLLFYSASRVPSHKVSKNIIWEEHEKLLFDQNQQLLKSGLITQVMVENPLRSTQQLVTCASFAVLVTPLLDFSSVMLRLVLVLGIPVFLMSDTGATTLAAAVNYPNAMLWRADEGPRLLVLRSNCSDSSNVSGNLVVSAGGGGTSHVRLTQWGRTFTHVLLQLARLFVVAQDRMCASVIIPAHRFIVCGLTNTDITLSVDEASTRTTAPARQQHGRLDFSVEVLATNCANSLGVSLARLCEALTILVPVAFGHWLFTPSLCLHGSPTCVIVLDGSATMVTDVGVGSYGSLHQPPLSFYTEVLQRHEPIANVLILLCPQTAGAQQNNPVYAGLLDWCKGLGNKKCSAYIASDEQDMLAIAVSAPAVCLAGDNTSTNVLLLGQAFLDRQQRVYFVGRRNWVNQLHHDVSPPLVEPLHHKTATKTGGASFTIGGGFRNTPFYNTPEERAELLKDHEIILDRAW